MFADWDPSQVLHQLDFRKTTFWVQLYNLSVMFHTMEMVMELVAQVGNFVSLNKTKLLRLEGPLLWVHLIGYFKAFNAQDSF